MSFPARYQITALSKGYSGLSSWVRHIDCADVPETASDAGRTCARCWLAISANGACGCDEP